MEYVMGIDGGGTKTSAVIADMKGNIVTEAISGPTNLNTVSAEEIALVFQHLFVSLEKQLPAVLKRVTAVFAGMAGAGNIENKNSLYKLLRRYLPEDTAIQVEMDAVNALYSGTFGSAGIVQISGTGSVTYGMNSNGDEERVGGWGYLLGDEGSGYDIGRQGLAAGLKYFDGRGTETIILQLIYDHFSVSHPQELIKKIYASASPKNEISQLSKIVFQAYKEADKIAVDIIKEAAKEIAGSIKTLSLKHFKNEGLVHAVLCGGIFNEKEIIPAFVKEELSQMKNIQLILPAIPPVIGSIVGAYKMKEVRINDNILHNLKKVMK